MTKKTNTKIGTLLDIEWKITLSWRRLERQVTACFRLFQLHVPGSIDFVMWNSYALHCPTHNSERVAVSVKKRENCKVEFKKGIFFWWSDKFEETNLEAALFYAENWVYLIELIKKKRWEKLKRKSGGTMSIILKDGYG